MNDPGFPKDELLTHEAIRLRAQGGALAEQFHWLLHPGQIWRIGRATEKARPEIQLGFDLSVSREHARIKFEYGCWWIEDIGSSGGTLVDEIEIRGKGAVELSLDSRIRVGKTLLVVEPSYRHRLHFREATMEIDVAPALNYPMVHCGQPFVSRLRVRNDGKEYVKNIRIGFVVPGFAACDALEVPPLNGGENCVQGPVPFHFNLSSLEQQPETLKTQLIVSLHDERRNIPLHVLAANEWSFHPQQRTTLASFVLPHHPLLQRIDGEVGAQWSVLTNNIASSLSLALTEEKTEVVVRAFYEYFRSAWEIEYKHEMPSFQATSQKIRLPHQVLLDSATRRGMGTCVDLVLLVASCLASAGAQPLILLLQSSEAQHHALLGCWRAHADRRQAILHDKERLLQDAVLVECTGISQRQYPGETKARTLEFEEARARAEAMVHKSDLLCALDITAARKEGVPPLPFAGDPQDSEAVAEIIRRARNRASPPHGSTLLHLLWSLLSVPDGLLMQGLMQLQVNPEDVTRELDRLLSPSHPGADVKRSAHFDEAISIARLHANRSGSYLVREEDLLQAVLRQGAAVKSFLSACNIDADKLLTLVGQRTGAPPSDDPSFLLLSPPT